MGFRGGGQIDPPQSILVFKYPSRDRVKRHFLYVHTADKAFIQAKDVTHAPAKYEEYVNPGGTAFRRNVSANELLFSLFHGDDCGGRIKMSKYKELFSADMVKRDNIADLATKAESTKDAATSCETLSLNEPSRRMLRTKWIQATQC